MLVVALLVTGCGAEPGPEDSPDRRPAAVPAPDAAPVPAPDDGAPVRRRPYWAALDALRNLESCDEARPSGALVPLRRRLDEAVAMARSKGRAGTLESQRRDWQMHLQVSSYAQCWGGFRRALAEADAAVAAFSEWAANAEAGGGAQG
jgi:hypothetical protein